MIKRQSSNQISQSLVNTAQSDHYNVSGAVNAEAPITNNTSVKHSINFINDKDGSYILRNPIIKKENLSNDTSWYLYDNDALLQIIKASTATTLGISSTNDKIQNITLCLRYYTYDLKYITSSSLNQIQVPWIDTILNVYNATEYTLMSIILDYSKFPTTDTTTTQKLISTDTNYLLNGEKKVYRLLKISKDADKENTWDIDIVYPEFNSITSSTDTDNAESLEVNLLLDNPYAIRDLYGYGYNSATKILAYVPIGYTTDDLKSLKVIQLTEDVCHTTTGTSTTKGFKVLVSSNPVEVYGQTLILKACITTSLTKLKYYCCWERSTNGIDWDVCPEFIAKFLQSTTNLLADILVSDITSSEFEKIAYDDTLEKAATYLVTKKMVLMNPNYASKDLSEQDCVADRPDILIINSPQNSAYYRFSVYVDTGKSSPIPDTVTKTLSKSYLEELGTEETVFDNSNEKIVYQTFNNDAVNPTVETSSESESASSSLKSPELVNGELILYESNDSTKLGNMLKITSLDKDYVIKSVKIVLDNQTYHASKTETSDTTTSAAYYSEQGTYLYVKAYDNSTVTEPSSIASTDSDNIYKINANESKTFTVNENSTGKNNAIIIANASKTMESTIKNENVDNKVEYFRSKIKTIEIKYETSSGISTTSIYLTSQTGNYQIPYSTTTQYLEDLSLDRERLFTDKVYEYKSQLLFYGNGSNVYVSNQGSSIIKLLSTLSFGTEVTKLLSYRNYLVVFTTTSINLLKYDAESNEYTNKVLTSAIGISKNDADTVCVILNTIYFKSGSKIYKLTPNLYASADDILNISVVSNAINNFLEETLSKNTELENFVYADADTYNLFIPLHIDDGITYCCTYDLTRKLWTIQKYPILCTNIEIKNITNAYLKTKNATYYFKEKLENLLNTFRIKDFSSISYSIPNTNTENNTSVYSGLGCKYTDLSGESITVTALGYALSIYNTFEDIYNKIPYGDLDKHTLTDLYNTLNNKGSYNIKNIFSDKNAFFTPIDFEIDFGQKSSNYTIDKQFLESKLLFASMHSKEVTPIKLTITTDGIQRPLHWDVNTDSALWKNSFEQLGTLSTDFGTINQEYDGLIRQLIVKYSGRGKTIRHLISGTSLTKFKFYSMDVKSRILPTKQ